MSTEAIIDNYIIKTFGSLTPEGQYEMMYLASLPQGTSELLERAMSCLGE